MVEWRWSRQGQRSGVWVGARGVGAEELEGGGESFCSMEEAREREALWKDVAAVLMNARDVARGRFARLFSSGSGERGEGTRVGTSVRVSGARGRVPSGAGGSEGGERTESRSNAVSNSPRASLT